MSIFSKIEKGVIGGGAIKSAVGAGGISSGVIKGGFIKGALGIKKAEAILRAWDKKVTTDVVSDTLNHVAFYTRLQLRNHIKSVFDRPTPRTVNSVLVKKADAGPNPQAKVYINDDGQKGSSPAKYLATEESGGVRSDKRSERALKYAGILGNDQQMVPIVRDNFGNYKGGGGKITQMLAALQANPSGSDSKKEAKIKAWRVMRRKGDGKPFGIATIDKAGRPLLQFVFTKRQSYRARFKFSDIVKQSWNEKIKEAWAKSYAKHLAGTLRL